jgi:hypothetical protein
VFAILTLELNLDVSSVRGQNMDLLSLDTIVFQCLSILVILSHQFSLSGGYGV